MSEDSENFIFIFNDKRKIYLSQDKVFDISTTFYNKHIDMDNQNKISIPDNISYESFKEFLSIFNKYSPESYEQNSQENKLKLIVNENIDPVQLIQISEYFENDSFTKFLIKELFLNEENKINKNNSYLLLILSFNKLNELNNNFFNEKSVETVWLALYEKSLDFVGKNFIYFFESGKLEFLDKNIIDKLFGNFSMTFFRDNFIIVPQEDKNDENENIINSQSEYKEQNKKEKNENNIYIKENIFNFEITNYRMMIKATENIVKLNILRKIIEFLIKRRSQEDFFSLLSNEFMRITSEENLNEINNYKEPSLLLKVNINYINTYYKELSLEYDKRKQNIIVIIIYYKKAEDSFNVSIKLRKINKQNGNNNYGNTESTNNNSINTFEIFTFLSCVSIEELDIKQNYVKLVSNNKSMQEILKINKFSKLLSNSKNEYLTIKIFLKLFYNHSLLCKYLFYDFENLYNNKNIFKIPKNLFNIIIMKKIVSNNEINMDKIIICLFNWLNDEVNIKEDISEIIENIKWNNISIPLLFEFIIKYAKNISQDKLEHIFLNSLIGTSENYLNIELFNQYIIKTLINSAKKVDYISLFCENQQLNKINSNQIINHKRNKSLNETLQNKNNKKCGQNNLNNNKDNIIINSYYIKQNKSTNNSNKLKIKDSKKNKKYLNKKNYNLSKVKKKEMKNNSKDNNNQRNKSIDINDLKNQKNKSMNNKVYNNIFNKKLCNNNKIYNLLNNKEYNDKNKKKSKDKISFISQIDIFKYKLKHKKKPK